jgi:hypothetical protein
LSREIAVRYTNDLTNVAGIDISKGSWRVQAIRRLSDFRDDVVSKTGLGRWFIRSYRENGSDWNRVVAVLIGLFAVAVVSWYVRKGKRRSLNSGTPSLPDIGNCR